MARKPSLSVVTDETPAPKKAPRTITEAADKGTQRELLVTMRTRIAKSLDDPNTLARDLASLSRRLLEISREIDAIDVAEKQEADESDEVADEELTAEAF